MGLDPELKKLLISIEKRLDELEKVMITIQSEKVTTSGNKQSVKKKNRYDGLTGGIRFLIDNDFFKKPKEMREINNELKREGYHYPDPSTFKIISVDFIKKQKILTRLKEGRNYKYVIRK